MWCNFFVLCQSWLNRKWTRNKKRVESYSNLFCDFVLKVNYTEYVFSYWVTDSVRILWNSLMILNRCRILSYWYKWTIMLSQSETYIAIILYENPSIIHNLPKYLQKNSSNFLRWQKSVNLFEILITKYSYICIFIIFWLVCI